MLGHKYGGLIQCSSASGFLLKTFSIASQPSLNRLLVLPNMSASGNEQSEIQEDVEEAEKANENDSQALFDVYVYDDRSGQAKMEKFVTLGSFKNVQGTKLSQIRAMLNNENALSFRLQGAPFCNKIGAVANENLPFAEYIKSLDRGGTKSEEKTEQQGYSLIVPTGDAPVTEPHAYAVYFKPRALSAGMDDATKEFMKEKLDLELRKAELKTGDKPDILTSSYNHSSFMAGISKTDVVHPADMTQGQWNIVMETNSLLHASYVRLPSHGIVKKVERSMYPAFKLRPRQFYDFNASLDHKDIAAPMRNLIIPRYRVEDDSYVEVSENQTSVARAIASSSLSEIAAEAAVAGVNAGFKNEEAASKSNAKTKNTKQMTITYNFPRVVLQLDEESLQLSDECAEALKHVKDKASLQAFKDKYGTFFATRIELGGRLHATEDSTALAEEKVAEKSKAMKIAAGLSFSSPYVQASVSASSASSNASKDEKNNSSLNLGMTWEAKGGDTLLCNNPSAWCATVASFYNWRVVKQENLLSIEDMISRIPECASAKSVLDSILNDKTVPTENSIPVRFKRKAIGHSSMTLEDQPSEWIKKQIWRTAPGSHSPQNEKLISTPTVDRWREENSKKWRTVYLLADSKPASHRVFNMHGPNSNGRLLNGYSYTICGDMDNTYLQGTSTLPEYKKSFLHDGVKETAWTFKIKSTNYLLPSGAVLNPGTEVHLQIYDHEGRSLGPMSHFSSSGIGFLAISEKDPVNLILEYP
ncbi:hypothetical protein BDV39DRAFT_207618 [Aspergillus sergii]|uniref:MACPF domain-containing protein n=1 Tax=Aspergillus sergii TaxID=1034303 RepID=A0A5N6WV02_9EURO|nr:hypothetical protein BDV39DRAFT_207618 [Aspergillus sergii]